MQLRLHSNRISSVFWLAFLLVLAPATLFSQSPSPQQQPSSAPLTPQQLSLIQDSLQQFRTIKELCLLLGPDLATWPVRIASLQATLEQQKQSETQNAQRESQQTIKSQQDLQASEAARAQALAESDKSQTALTVESKTFNDYKQASKAALAILEAQLAQERAHRLFTDYATWASIGAAGGAIAGEAAGKSTLSSAEGAGIGALGLVAVKVFGDFTHLW